MIQRDESMAKLEACAFMYNLKSQDTFAEGVAPLVTMALGGVKEEQDVAGVTRTTLDSEVAETETTSEEWGIAKWIQVVLTTAIGIWLAWAWATIVGWIFFIPAGIITTILPFMKPIVWLIQFAVWGGPAYLMFQGLWDGLGTVLGLKSAEAQLEQCMEDTILLGHWG